MISIIVCSRNKSIPSSLNENIIKTVGVKFELIVINNIDNKYSIFEAYNLGIRKSRYEYLCFIHDDIFIHTVNWGHIVIEIFKNNIQIGLIGVAGAKVKTKIPSTWWACPEKQRRINIIQHFSNKNKTHWEIGWKKENIEEVVAIDGVFMIAKNVGLTFNEKMKGFHNYDLNISFEYLKNNYSVVVSKEILIEHYSIGKLDKTWYESSIILHKLYSNLLPLTTLKEYDFKSLEFKNAVFFINNLLSFKLQREAIYFWIKSVFLNPFNRFHFKFLKKIFKLCSQ